MRSREAPASQYARGRVPPPCASGSLLPNFRLSQCGRDDRTRTGDFLIDNQMCYQLHYAPVTIWQA